MLIDYLNRIADPPSEKEKMHNDVQFENAEMSLDQWYEVQECESSKPMRTYNPGIDSTQGRRK